MNKHILCIGGSKFQSRMFRPQKYLSAVQLTFAVQPAKTFVAEFGLLNVVRLMLKSVFIHELQNFNHVSTIVHVCSLVPTFVDSFVVNGVIV